MGNLRRLLLPVLALLMAAAVAAPAAGATAPPRALSVRMDYACAVRATGQLKYVSSTAACNSKGQNPTERLVPIRPGPHYFCVHANDAVFLAGTLGDCSVPGYRAALTVPPAAGQLHFCALLAGGLLSYISTPGRCNPATQFPVGVSAPPPGGPVIGKVGIAPVAYRVADPPVAVSPALTIGDDQATTLTGATVSIAAGFDQGADTLSYALQSGITGGYDAGAGVLTLRGAASLDAYRAVLRSVAFASSDAAPVPAARVATFRVTDARGVKSDPARQPVDVSRSELLTAVNHAYQAVGNTPLGVGTSPAGPAATVGGSLLDGAADADPAATLGVTGHTAPGHGTVTVSPDGTFTYQPAVGYSGTDTFRYTVTGSTDPGGTATATVTLTVGPVVWYVDDAQPPGGTGAAGSPFSTLAAANAAAGADSTVFVYHGTADYTDGAVMQPGESLLGQPHGLTVDGYPLVAAGGSSPVIANPGGDAIDLADGATVAAVNVTGFEGGNGLAVAGGGGLAGTVAVTDVRVTGGVDNGAEISDADGSLRLSIIGSTFTGGINGIMISSASALGATVTLEGNNFQGIAGTAIGISSGSGGSVAGTVDGNAIGGQGNSSSGATTGIAVSADGAGLAGPSSADLTIYNNGIYESDRAGIDFGTSGTNPSLNLTITGNAIGDPQEGTPWGIHGQAGDMASDGGTVCAGITGNTLTGSGHPGQGGADIELDQNGATTVTLPGYAGAAGDTFGAEEFLTAANGGTPTTLARVSGSGGGFAGGAACASPS